MLWSTGYESGFAGFKSTPWDAVPLAPVISSVARSGSSGGAYTIPGGGNRSENVPDMASFKPGDDLWFSFSARLGNDVPTTGQWQVFAQWKNDGVGSPPLEMAIESGQFKIGGGWGWPGTDNPTSPKLAMKSLGTAVTGTWVDWRIHIVFSADPTKGYVEVWRDGTKVLNPWYPPRWHAVPVAELLPEGRLLPVHRVHHQRHRLPRRLEGRRHRGLRQLTRFSKTSRSCRVTTASE